MPIEDRIRRAAENILENSSLGDDLMDDEAQNLLDWGLNLAERYARSTHTLDDNQAAPVIDESLTVLRRTMRRVSKLVGNLAAMDQEAAENRLTKILEAADQLPRVEVRPPDDLHVELDTLRSLSPGEALRRVLSWIDVGEEA